tara:strand:- start:271 stop:1023 length:753 start_codon:yes stop_codon:yes gene_type:complete
MAWAAIAVGVVSVASTAIANKKNRDAAEDAATDANAKQAIETAKLEKQKAEYKAMKFENPYANMENAYEDLTVNQQQAQFQSQQGSQQRANIMQNLKGAAGGSGIAGLAQAMANQGQLQTQQISASIGQQESANQKLKARGAAAADLQQRKGQEMEQQFNIDRQSTLLGMQMGASAGANLGAQNAALNEQQVDAQANSAMAGSIGSAASGIGGAMSARQANPSGGGYTTTNDPNMIDNLDENFMSPRIDD